jgi:hypothetical protein
MQHPVRRADYLAGCFILPIFETLGRATAPSNIVVAIALPGTEAVVARLLREFGSAAAIRFPPH